MRLEKGFFTRSHTKPNLLYSPLASESESSILRYVHGIFFYLAALCLSPKGLGMESGKIPDDAITASSFYNHDYKPEYGR